MDKPTQGPLEDHAFNAAEVHRRILALPPDKQLHVAADMVATGRPALVSTVIPLLEYVLCDLRRMGRAAAQKAREGK